MIFTTLKFSEKLIKLNLRFLIKKFYESQRNDYTYKKIQEIKFKFFASLKNYQISVNYFIDDTRRLIER